jgi:FkbM family methyltransferase
MSNAYEASRSAELNSENYRISLIVTVYDIAEPLLSDCLRSIARQSLRPHEFEVILVDDCSTLPHCTIMLAQFVQSHSNARVLRTERRRGPNHARQVGVMAANGDYVLFLDGDDQLSCVALECLRETAWNFRADFVSSTIEWWSAETGRAQLLPATTKPFDHGYMARLHALHQVVHSVTMCGRLMRRSLLTDEIFELPEHRLAEDMTTTTRVLLKARVVAATPETLYYYTVNPESRSHRVDAQYIRDLFANLEGLYDSAVVEGYLGLVHLDLAKGLERAVYGLVGRVLQCPSSSDRDKAELLSLIAELWQQFPVAGQGPQHKTLDQFSAMLAEAGTQRHAWLVEKLSALFAVKAVDYGKARQFDLGLEPSGIALRLKGRVVFICDVDYQLRNAAAIGQILKERGFHCAVLDNSRFASEGKRQLPAAENTLFRVMDRIQVPEPPYGRDWLATARLVVTFNDWSPYFRDALDYRAMLHLPTVGMVEGISDFLRLDMTPFRALPYRRTDCVFLCGEDDQQFFEDRDTRVIGMPVVERLWQKDVVFPETPLAVVNVNFSYGVLEWDRNTFVRCAMTGCETAGIDVLITRHPQDRATLDGLPVSSLTQYQLIDRCSLFISRFATGIIEALASGKPVIYLNPHGEKVTKFHEPMGAFRMAENAEQLAAAINDTLEDIKAGVDFRKRASAFLQHHANYSGTDSVTVRAADQLSQLAWNPDHAGKLAHQSLLRVLQPSLGSEPGDGLIGDYPRPRRALFHEEEWIALLLDSDNGLMIDVGASLGNACDVYLGRGWTVHAFEPDPNNRRRLVARFGHDPRLTVNEEAVADVSGQELPFFASAESTGISSLSAFTRGHQEICRVRTITLSDYMEQHDLAEVDFLKIDVEGHDLFVLKGFPWSRSKPAIVLAEFEDFKTRPLQYSVHDLAGFLQQHGYSVYVSEWHPIERYGPAHEWRRLLPYDPRLELSETWGNLVGFREDPGFDRLQLAALRALKFNRPPVAPPATPPAITAGPDVIPEPVAAQGGILRKTMVWLLTPVFFFGVWVLKTLARTRIGARIKAKLEWLYDAHIGRTPN